MKNYPAILILLITIFCASCSKNYITTSYDKSYDKWLLFKNSSHNSYTYTVDHGSVFGGYSATVFIIKNGLIVSRKFSTGRFKPDTDSLIVQKTWTEDANSLNTHGTEGDDLLTLDDIYNKTKTVWLRADESQNDIYFETRNDGLISLAGFVPKGCQDDCLNGITIKNINPM